MQIFQFLQWCKQWDFNLLLTGKVGRWKGVWGQVCGYLTKVWIYRSIYVWELAKTAFVYTILRSHFPCTCIKIDRLSEDLSDWWFLSQNTRHKSGTNLVQWSVSYTSFFFCGEMRILLKQSRVTIIGYGLMDIWRYRILQFQVYQRKWILCLDMATSELLVLQQNRLTIWILLMLSLFLAVILGNHFRWLPCIY
jgi:hypothetical protein